MSNRTFSPTIRGDRILAGGLSLAEVDAERGEFIFPDRCRERSAARGTDMVRVSIEEFLDELLLYLQEGQV